jgi:hypothetical protein
MCIRKVSGNLPILASVTNNIYYNLIHWGGGRPMETILLAQVTNNVFAN